MKKLLALMLAAGVTLTGLVACSGNNEKETSEQPTTETETTETPKEQVEIKLWIEGDAWAEALIPALEEALPHIKINYENVGGFAAGGKMELDGPAGLGADIFLTPHDGLGPLYEASGLLPLGADIQASVEERFLPGSAGTVIKDNGIYGIPLATENIALFYNKTLLEENGFEVAKSFEEIKEQAAIYNDASKNKFLMRFKAGDAYDMQIFLSAAGYQPFGPNYNDANQYNFNSKEVLKGLTYFEEMKEILPVPQADLNWDTVHGEFVKGAVPYIISGPWSINEVLASSEELGFEWGITTIPTINGVQPQVFSGNIIGCVSSYTKHPEEAKEVLEFMASDEGLKIMYETTSKIPALKDNSTIAGVSENPYVSGILEQAIYATPTPNIPQIRQYWEPTQTAFRSVWDGVATPEEAIEKAQSDYELAIKMTE